MLQILAFARSPLGRYTIAALALPALAFGLYTKGHHDGKAGEVRAEASRAAEAHRRDEAAKLKADQERARDTASVSALQKELTDAYASQPDSKPSPARLAMACARLRLAKPAARLPAACRPTG